MQASKPIAQLILVLITPVDSIQSSVLVWPVRAPCSR